MPRLFVALPVPADIGLRLSLLSGGLTGADWSTPDSFHIKLNFIGSVDGRMADDIAIMLDQILAEPMDLRLNGLGCFGSSKPRALYASVQPCEPLNRLQSSLDHRLRMMGLSPDKRKFLPQIHLAHLHDVAPQAVANWLSNRGGFASRNFEVDRFGLYSSYNKRGNHCTLEAEYKLSDTSDLWWTEQDAIIQSARVSPD